MNPPDKDISKLSSFGLCTIDNNNNIELSSKGIKLQDNMGLHTKILNQLKVEGNKANTMFDEMLNKLED